MNFEIPADIQAELVRTRTLGRELFRPAGLEADRQGGPLATDHPLFRHMLALGFGRTSWRPEVPGRRFESVVFYTRQECHLCDEAHALLLEYQDWLPEIVDVDIDDDPELQQQFGTVVPVIECDGKIRFRGRVSEILLRRLLEGTTPRDRRRGCGSRVQ